MSGFLTNGSSANIILNPFIYTIAGTGTAGTGADGAAPLISALSSPSDVYVDSVGNVFVVDNGNHRVRMIAKTGGTNYGVVMTAGYIYTIAGTGTLGTGADGAPLTSALYYPNSVFVDSAGNVFITDGSNYRVRMIAKTGGTNYGVAMTANNIYTIAGTGTAGKGADGAAPLTSALNTPRGVCVDSAGNVFIADSNNHRVRMIAKTGGTNYGVVMTAGNIYTIAGTGTSGTGADGAPLTSALAIPNRVYVDSVGNVFVVDNGNHRVRMIAKTGGTNYGVVMTANNIYTIAGTGSSGTGADGAPLISALSSPQGVSVDSAGNVFITEYGNDRVRMIAKTGGTNYGVVMTAGNIYTIAGTGTEGTGADGAPLTSALKNPQGLYVDSVGNVFIADFNNNRVRMIFSYANINLNNSTGSLLLQTVNIKPVSENNIYTIAGTGTLGTGADGAPLTSALYLPDDLFIDSTGNVFITDYGNNRVRMIAKTGGTNYGVVMTANNIYTIAGTGTAGAGTDGAPLISALNNPQGVCVDSTGNVFLADLGNHRVRMIAKTGGTNYGVVMTAGNIYTIAGTGTQGKGANGAPLISALDTPQSVFVDSAGNVFIADYGNSRVRMIATTGGTNYGVVMTANNIYTIAGTGTAGTGADGAAPLTSALSYPIGVFVDSAGNVFIADYGNNRVRMIAKTGGTNYGVVMTAGNIYTIAGTGTLGTGANGAPLTSALSQPQSVSIDSAGNVFIADTNNHRVRMIAKTGGTNYGVVMTAGNIYTIAGTGTQGKGTDGAPLISALNTPIAVFVDSAGNVFIADYGNHRVRMIATKGSVIAKSILLNYIYTIAGTGTLGKGADGVPLNSALNSPRGVSIDSAGNVFITENGNDRVRMIAKTGGTNYGVVMTAGYIYTIAGTGTAGTGLDGVPLNSALNNPYSVCVDSAGNVFITDSSNHRVRMIAKTGGTNYGVVMTANNIYTIAGTGTAGTGADGASLTSALNLPIGIFVNSAGNVFIAEAGSGSSRVRMIAKTGGTNYGVVMTAGNIYTIAGTGTEGTGADGAPLTSALNLPFDIFVDSKGNVFITDSGNNRVRMIVNTVEMNNYYDSNNNDANYFDRNSGYLINNSDACNYNSLLYSVTYQ